MSEHDVVVVGAGPVGLLLAAELALGGADVVVLERLREPSGTIKAGSINLASAELLGRRGLLEELRAAAEGTLDRLSGADARMPGGAAREDIRSLAARAGHFAGLWLPGDAVDGEDPALVGHRDALGATMVPQRDLEAILFGHAERLAVPVRRGVAVTALAQHGDRVSVHTDAGVLDAGWVVGCDGGRSVVRHATGVAFPGTEPEITGRQAIVELEDDALLDRGWHWGPGGVYCYGPTPGRVLTVEFDGPPAERDAPVTVQELQDSLRAVSGSPVRVRSIVGAATRWTDNARQAATYRAGRVLLAGDAAHVHSPFSGQGLNLGLGDAMNLGWKLARAVTGAAGQELLDTYTAERHPVGEWVLEWTRAQVALMRPDPKVGPLRTVMADLIGTRDGATRLSALISGVDRRLPGVDSPNPLVGRTVPDLSMSDGAPLRTAFGAGRFVLARPESAGVVDVDAAVEQVTVRGADALLARPDGVVVWAGSATQVPDLSGVC